MRLKTAAIVMVSAALILVSQAPSAPQPSEIPMAWELDFEFLPLQAINVHVPGEEKPRLFWYLRYQVVNRSGEDRIFVPNFELYTQTGQLLPAGKHVPSYTFDFLKKTLNDPFLKDIPGITGRLLQGEDNARTGLAIWSDFDPAAGQVELYVGGLSGENVEIQLPVSIQVTEINSRGDSVTVTRDKLLLTRTLALRYLVPGEAQARLRSPVKLEETRWIMR